MNFDVIIHQYKNTFVVRDDLIEGGTKRRAFAGLPSVSGMIYAGPSWGGAAVAMSYECKKRNIPCTLFYPKRKNLTSRQRLVRQNGAKIIQVPHGRLTVIKHRAKEYQKKTGYHLVKWGGGDHATRAILKAAQQAKEQIKDCGITSLWCSTGSGTLISALSEVFDIPCYGVIVGYNVDIKQLPNVKKLYKHPLIFSQKTSYKTPFPSCKHYDAKGYEMMIHKRKKGEKTLFWNVMEDHCG